jgi:hypothetical protein
MLSGIRPPNFGNSSFNPGIKMKFINLITKPKTFQESGLAFALQRLSLASFPGH